MRFETSRRAAGRRSVGGTSLLATTVCLLSAGTRPVAQDSALATTGDTASQSLEATRLTMGKWIETQQILSKERNDWQQGKEILLGRLELVKKELATLQESIQREQASATATSDQRNEILAKKSQLEAAGARLLEAATRMEGEIRRLFPTLPGPIQERVQRLYERIPESDGGTRVSIAERFQNVLGILNEVNKANNEITVTYEVHTLSDGRPSEVKAIYVGLAQAYYVSPGGEAGIGRPGPEGWTWEPSSSIAGDVLVALGILQGKHSPAFVSLPVTLR